MASRHLRIYYIIIAERSSSSRSTLWGGARGRVRYYYILHARVVCMCRRGRLWKLVP